MSSGGGAASFGGSEGRSSHDWETPGGVADTHRR
jgi:hypothetical protein